MVGAFCSYLVQNYQGNFFQIQNSIIYTNNLKLWILKSWFFQGCKSFENCMQSRMIWHHIPRYLFLKTFLLCEWILLKCVKHDSYFSLPDETLIEFNFFSCLKKDFTQNIRSQCSLCYHHRVFNGFLNAKIKRSVTNLLFCPFIQNSEIFFIAQHFSALVYSVFFFFERSEKYYISRITYIPAYYSPGFRI